MVIDYYFFNQLMIFFVKYAIEKKYKSIITNPIARAAIPIKTVFLRPILEGKFAAKRKVRIDEMVKIITIVEAIPSSPKIFYK